MPQKVRLLRIAVTHCFITPYEIAPKRGLKKNLKKIKISGDFLKASGDWLAAKIILNEFSHRIVRINLFSWLFRRIW